MSKREQYKRRMQKVGEIQFLLEMMDKTGFHSEIDASSLSMELKKLLEDLQPLQKKLQILQEKLETNITYEDAFKIIQASYLQEVRTKKAKRIQEKKEEYERRKRQWNKKKRESIVHVGNGYSNFLNQHETDVNRLKSLNLPVLENEGLLCEHLGIEISDLRWLVYHRDVVQVCHYHFVKIPKKKGGTRTISIPKSKLARVQEILKDSILNKMEISPDAHGFVPQRSIFSNAQVHRDSKLIINVDLKDFFPSITFKRVVGMFKQFGYSGRIASLIALLCTYPEYQKTRIADQSWYVIKSARALPQGACTSPAITNLICRRLDRRFRGLAEKSGLRYSRYADDITFSTKGNLERATTGKFLYLVRKIIKDEGFTANEKKIKIVSNCNRMEITGLLVNEGRPHISLRWLKILRAKLHDLKVNGITDDEDRQTLKMQVAGMIAFVNMVMPEKASKFQKEFDKIISK
ncbi:MAG: reverse transcriptase family protein [Promethearchaeota archaeon]